MSYFATNFVKRLKLARSIGESGGINTTPELTPKDNIQAYMNAMTLFGGGEVRLGPYYFVIQSKANDDTDAATANYWTVPANVTLVGVPNKTVIYKAAYFEESVGHPVVNLKSCGPIVSLEGNGASIRGCTVFLDLYAKRDPNESDSRSSSGADFRSDGSGGIGLYLPWLSLGVEAVPRKNTCCIYVGGNTYYRRRIQDCTIGSPTIDKAEQDFIGIHLDNTSYTKTMISNNHFMNFCGTVYTAGVYFEDGTQDNAVVGNIAANADPDFVSIEDAGSLAQNVVSGNVPSTAASSTSYGLRA